MNFTFVWYFLVPMFFVPFLVRFFQKPLPEQAGQQALCVPFFRNISAQKSFTKKRFFLYKTGVPFLMAWLFFILALMRPVVYGEGFFMPDKARQVMLVLDVSGSMAKQDFLLNGKQMTRLGATKEVASNFIDGRKGDAVGLIIFGSEAFVYVPLTQDVKTAKSMLQEVGVGMAGEMTAVGDALGLALKQMYDIPSDEKVIVLLSDGFANAGMLMPEDAIEQAKKMNVKIYTIGLGADEQIVQFGFFSKRVNPSADLDEKILKQVADETGGQYFRVKTTEDLKDVYAQIDKLEPVDVNGIFVRPQKEFFWIPLMISAFLFLISFMFKQRFV